MSVPRFYDFTVSNFFQNEIENRVFFESACFTTISNLKIGIMLGSCCCVWISSTVAPGEYWQRTPLLCQCTRRSMKRTSFDWCWQLLFWTTYQNTMSDDYISSYINKILLPGGGRKYSGKRCTSIAKNWPDQLLRCNFATLKLQEHIRRA